MKTLGIDLGAARIGLALADDLGMLAHPLETIVVKAVANPLAHIVEVVRREGVSAIVLGLPRNMDGSYGAAAEKTRAFAAKLKARVSCPIHFWDERLTSVAAQRALHETGRTVKQSRAVIDQVAAQMILQGWLDGQSLNPPDA